MVGFKILSSLANQERWSRSRGCRARATPAESPLLLFLHFLSTTCNPQGSNLQTQFRVRYEICRGIYSCIYHIAFQESTQQSLDGFDQNFFMSLNTTLNTLQANQIDDLENVLLPHLTMDRADSAPLNRSAHNSFQKSNFR